MAQKRSAWPPRVVRSASKLTLPEARTRRLMEWRLPGIPPRAEVELGRATPRVVRKRNVLVNHPPVAIDLLEYARSARPHLYAGSVHVVEAPGDGDVSAHDNTKIRHLPAKAFRHVLETGLAGGAQGIDATIGERRLVLI